MRVSVLSVPAAVPLVTPLLATSESPSWRGPPATRDLHIALKPHRKNALIDGLYEVGGPCHPKHVFSTTPFSCACTHVYHCYSAHLPKEQAAQRPHSLELYRDAETARPLYFSSRARTPAGSGGAAWLPRLDVEFSEAHLYSTVPRLVG
ncbi:hypothetical protein EDB85DRAFT_2002231 [Lactarius pseudohatsudake]|nr:hypothetical protein EDB85DRAFT_2002231 [Lactarius pseudohatsudake]